MLGSPPCDGDACHGCPTGQTQQRMSYIRWTFVCVHSSCVGFGSPSVESSRPRGRKHGALNTSRCLSFYKCTTFVCLPYAPTRPSSSPCPHLSLPSASSVLPSRHPSLGTAQMSMMADPNTGKLVPVPDATLPPLPRPAPKERSNDGTRRLGGGLSSTPEALSTNTPPPLRTPGRWGRVLNRLRFVQYEGILGLTM